MKSKKKARLWARAQARAEAYSSFKRYGNMISSSFKSPTSEKGKKPIQPNKDGKKFFWLNFLGTESQTTFGAKKWSLEPILETPPPPIKMKSTHFQTRLSRLLKPAAFQTDLGFYPIWANGAWFAAGSPTWQFLSLSYHTVRDAPPWVNWWKSLHWWRKVGKDWKKKI